MILPSVKDLIEKLHETERGDEILPLIDAVEDILTDEEKSELLLWIRAKAWETQRIRDESLTILENWYRVFSDDDTIEDIWDQMPTDLQRFLHREARKKEE